MVLSETRTDMRAWICRACGVEYPEAAKPPAECPICVDERQYVPRSGQAWTTIEQMSADGYELEIEEVESNLFGITASPEVGIGQRALLVEARRRGSDRGQSSAYVRSSGGVVQDLRWRAGLRGGGRQVVDSACRPSHPFLERGPRSSSRCDIAYGWRAFPRKRSCALDSRRERARSPSHRGQHFPRAQREMGDVHAQFFQHHPDVCRGCRSRCAQGD